jgi:glycosyltransferase involved in cell wall biosynthesis
MRVSQLIPGTGHFYCGSCLRDNALGKALLRRQHDVVMLPLYLPFWLEEEPPANGQQVLLGGVNMFLQHKASGFARLPRWLKSFLDSPRLLRFLARHSNMTDAAALGAMTLSTLRGGSGPQRAEIQRLTQWLSSQQPRPQVLCLSNAMLLGMARPLREAVGAPVVCSLQGEAPFLDALPDPYRAQAWQTLRERTTDVDAYIAVSDYYGKEMQERLGLDPAKVHVVHNGIEIPDLAAVEARQRPSIGYLARMCSDKGLHTLVQAFILLKQGAAHPQLQLRVAGVQLATDQAYVQEQRQLLRKAGVAADAEFLPNLDRGSKWRFLQSLDILSVPATYGESFGLYLLEAMACSVPVVQPRHGSFPEILEATGGGILCEPDDADSLASALDRLLTEKTEAEQLASRGRQAVLQHFTAERMAEQVEAVFEKVVNENA